MNSELMFSANHDNWSTPKKAYEALDKEFVFVDDPCPLGGTDGLTRPWGISVFVNPPYSNIWLFLEKAIWELHHGETHYVVFLVPSRTDTKWWHELVLPNASEIRFIKGRLKFGDAKNHAPFPSCVLVFKRSDNSRYQNVEVKN